VESFFSVAAVLVLADKSRFFASPLRATNGLKLDQSPAASTAGSSSATVLVFLIFALVTG
jgi:hypothetical protein